MKVAALCSGGKDGIYALWLSMKDGHEISEIVVMDPETPNSWMFHKPQPILIDLFQEAYGIPVKRVRTAGRKGEELEDLKQGLATLAIEGIVSGAVASNYQRDRIGKICEDLALSSILPLWKREQEEMLRDMIENNFKIIITSVAAEGFKKEWIGKKIDQNSLQDLMKLRSKKDIHIMGEGGEYESLVLDAPFFKKEIKIEDSKSHWEKDRGWLEIKKAYLTKK